jgi:IS5 family transposase
MCDPGHGSNNGRVNIGQQSFWDVEARQAKLNQQKDLLVRLNALITWEAFRPLLEQVHVKPRKSNAGRKPLDVIMMFKLLVLQQLYTISDAELEYQVNDRLSFMQFLGLGLEDRVPDATTVWSFRQQLTEPGLVEPLFEQFDAYLNAQGDSAKGGQIVDATLIPVPTQHNTKAENQQLKQGNIPDDWQNQPHKRAQKDTDARWTKKHGQSYFGYKNHLNVDVKHRLIRRYAVTDASVHDSQVLGQVLDAENELDQLWADSADRAEPIEAALKLMGFDSQIHQRAYRNRPLSEAEKQTNRHKSRTRARVEHVFGTWVMQMGGKLLRSMGLARAQTQLGLKNLTYNFLRFTQLETAKSA